MENSKQGDVTVSWILHDFEKEKRPKGFEIIKTTYDISLDSQISLLPRGFSPPKGKESSGENGPLVTRKKSVRGNRGRNYSNYHSIFQRINE